MDYTTLKILHIISAAISVTGIVYCVKQWFEINTAASALQSSQKITKITWYAIVPSVFFQVMSGFSIISVKHYPLHAAWILGSLTSFIILICAWFAFITLLPQMKRRVAQGALVSLCGACLLIMVFCMANTPS